MFFFDHGAANLFVKCDRFFNVVLLLSNVSLVNNAANINTVTIINAVKHC